MSNEEYVKESDHSEEKKELLALLLEEDGLNLDKPPVITPREGGGVVPLSFAQQRLWFLNQLVTGSTYNIYLAIRLKGLTNIKALEKSLNEIIRRHEALRTTFRSNGGRPVQVIAENMQLEIPLIDLSGQPRAEREVEAERLAREEAMRSFYLVKGPLFSAVLIRLSEEEHILSSSMHHIVSDGWSMGVFNAELTALYKAYCNGESSPLPELPIQYADFAHWQREWLQGEVLENLLSYWRKQLEGFPVLQLLTNKPRPAVQTYRGARQSLLLSATLTDALKAISQAEGATLFMTLLAAFNTLLYRHTGQEDIVVGSAIANRNRVETEGIIGFFVNSLAMRTDLSGNPTFRELICRVQRVALGAYEHQDLPFEKLVEELNPERDMSQTPLFQVMFNMTNVKDIAVELHNLSVERLPSVEPESKFDLTLYAIEVVSGIELRLVYNTDLFDSWRMAEMLKQYQMLLESIVSDSDQRISELSLLTEAERHQILVDWNDTQQDYSSGKTLVHLFEEQVERSPDAIAVVYEDQNLTYKELNKRANQLAHHLSSLGVGPETNVGLCVERSFEMVVDILGILKAGGAYVPMDPNYPQERLAFMAKDADLRVILTQEKFQERLSHLGGEHIHLDADWPVIGQEKESNPVSRGSADSLAYLIFTSGSTGRPKGVEVEHRQVLNYVDGILEQLKLPAGSSFATVSPLTADLGNTMLYPALATGGTLHIISEDRATDPEALGAYFKQHQPDSLKIVPSHLATLLMGAAPAEVLPQKRLVVGGEACPWQLVEKVQALKPGCRVINHYGPTETTVGVTTHQVEATDRTTIHSPSVPIGRPLPNSQLYILDSHKNPVPLGVAGEVYIGGRGLARGYAGAPELTAEKFVPHPYSEEPGARLYKTGDRAKFQPDGTIEFLGRIDHQVKLRGFRIELGEVEATLCLHPSVSEAVVVAREDRPGDKRLVAYVVAAAAKSAPSTGILRAFLQEKLPDYMIPSAFLSMDAMPLTANGKVDRWALPAPDVVRPELQEAFVAPRNQSEELVAGIWSNVLGLERIGVHDNFFELGGHSLLATRVVSRIREEFHVNLKLMDFFKMPIIAELTKRIEGLLWINAGRPSDDEAEFQDREEGFV